MEEAKHFWDLDRVAMWLGPLCQAVDAMTKDPQRSSLLTVDKKKSAQREALVYLFDKWPQVGRFGLQCSFFNQLSILLEDTRKAERRVNGTGHPPAELILRLAEHRKFFERYTDIRGSGIKNYWPLLFQERIQTFYETCCNNIRPHPNFSDPELEELKLDPMSPDGAYDTYP